MDTGESGRTIKPDALSERINKPPGWAQDYIHHVHTFVSAEEVQEIVFLRDQNRSLIKLVGELKCREPAAPEKAGESAHYCDGVITSTRSPHSDASMAHPR